MIYDKMLTINWIKANSKIKNVTINELIPEWRLKRINKKNKQDINKENNPEEANKLKLYLSLNLSKNIK